ncbi:MAG: ABC transporter permease [Spirochaetales bacterium]
MNRLKEFNWRYTFGIDAILIVLFVAGGSSVLITVALVEGFMWMLRLLWISPSMLMYILRRFAQAIPVLLSVLAIGFALIQIAPGDMFTQMELSQNISPEQLDRFRRQFRLDEPWYVQFYQYIVNAVQGEFGFSRTYRAPVFAIVSQRAANTILLSLTSLAFAWILSIPAGVFAAVNQYNLKDQFISVFAFFGLAIPNFFLAFLLLYLVSSTGNWLPLGGMTSSGYRLMGPVQQFFDVARHMIIPVVVIGTSIMATLTRVMRGEMLKIMNEQYVMTARAKGQSEGKVVYMHALRNAINPMITILGFQLGNVMSGAALVEIVVAWPGLGSVLLQALLSQDLYLVVGSLIYGVVLLVIGNLLADIALALVDPRVRVG